MNGGTGRRMRVEVLVASPPTKACRELLATVDSVVATFPDRLRLDVYYAGSQMTATPTAGFRGDPTDKRRKIPSVFVNGLCVAAGFAPGADAVAGRIAEELAKGEAGWQE